MKKQAIFAVSMLLSMGATQALPNWMNTAWTKACACGAYVRDSKVGNACAYVRDSKLGAFVGTQAGNVKASVPGQFVATRPYSTAAYAGSALLAEEAVRRGYAKKAVNALVRVVKKHPCIAGGVAAATAAGLGAAIYFDKVPARVNGAVKGVYGDMSTGASYLWTLARTFKKTTAGLITAGILAELGHCWKRGKALAAAKTVAK